MSQESEKNRKVYEFGDLSKYSLKQRLVIRLAGLVLFWLIKIIGKTIRLEVEGWENYEQIEKDGKIPIHAFWHDRIFLATYFFRQRGIIVMSSESFDSEYTARFIQRFGYGIIKGSSTRGGIRALTEMIRIMRQGFPTAFTLDGPKGPRYIVKAGACLLAKKSGNPILPFSIEAKKFWKVNSWDLLQIPKPFSRAKVFIDKPVYVSAEANDEEIENKRLELQNSLDELVKRGVQWRESEN